MKFFDYAPLALAMILTAATPAFAAASRPPNIVLILADDLGWRDVAFQNGDGFIETPNLDRLRAESMLFTDAYAGAANCAPSRACILSGMYTPRHGVYAVGSTDRGPMKKARLVPVPNSEELKPAFVTVAEALKARGYATGQFGKWHLGSDKDGTGPKQQGFDVSDARLISPSNKDGDGKSDPKLMHAITAAACDFIEANKTKPFFAYVAHHAIHSPLGAAPATIEKFKAKAKTYGAPHVAPLYAASLYDFDASVGVLLKKIEAAGLKDNTLVIFTSDNGGTPASINEPLRGAKGAYYEGGIREPFTVRWPGVVKPGSLCGVPVINQDLYPTFLTASGATSLPAGLDGVSLLPLFKGDAPPDARAIFWHFPGYLDNPVPRGRDPVFRTRPVTVIRKGDWKLFLYHEEWLLDGGREKIDTNGAVELYNLRDDRSERHELAATNKPKRDELLNELLAWLKATHATMPVPAAVALPPAERRSGDTKSPAPVDVSKKEAADTAFNKD